MTMNYLEKNKDNMRLRKPELYKIFEESKQQTGISVCSKEARDGNLVLHIEKDGKEHRLNSAYRPMEEAKRWASQYKFEHMDMVSVMFGLANGYLLEALVEEGASDTKYVVYEPNPEVLAHAFTEYDQTDILTNDRIHIATNEDALRLLLSGCLNVRNIGLLQVCAHPQYDELFPEEKVKFLTAIRDCSNLVITMQNTANFLGKRSVQNIISAVSMLPSNSLASELEKLAATGVPAYIVAAGPSLDKNVKELKAAKGHGVIIAVEKAIAILRREGIEPDYLIVEDAAKRPAYFSEPEVKQIPLLASMVANKEIVASHEGKVYFFGNDKYSFYLLNELGQEKNMVRTGGSVATAAFSVCAQMGFQTIVFVGQDLSYAADGSTHTGGIISGEKRQGNARYEVDGITGGKVRTRNDWYIFLKWFEGEMEEYPEISFIDATEGGAKMKGTTVATLKETVEKYQHLSVDCSDIAKGSEPLSEEALKRLSEIQKGHIKELKWLEDAMGKGIRAMTKLIRACDNRSILTTSYAGVLKEIEEINQKINELSVNLLLNDYVAKEANEAISGLNYMAEDEVANRKKVYEQSRKLYSIMEQGARELRVELEEAWKE